MMVLSKVPQTTVITKGPIINRMMTQNGSRKEHQFILILINANKNLHSYTLERELLIADKVVHYSEQRMAFEFLNLN